MKLRKNLTRLALAGLALTGAAALTVGVSSASAPDREPRPTVVLVHGAFADAASWNGVTEDLLRRGYPVVAAANPLRGLSSDAAYVKSLLDSVDGPVVLAGHSYGGQVITNAALGNPNVKALVYVAAFIPEQGESALELSGRFPGSTLGQTLEEVALPGGGTDLYVRQDLFREQFAADVPRSRASLMAATQRPVTTAALGEPSGPAAWKSIPSWSLVPTADKNIPPAAMRFMSDRAEARTVEVRGASHAVLVSRPDTVTDLIREAARATR